MSSEKETHKRDVNWLCVVITLQMLLSWLCGIHFIIYETPISTILFCILLILFGMVGVTAGAHRLWAHHSYQATPLLKIFLMLCFTLAGHTTIYEWVQYHRLHHKYFKTDLDPYNPKKGFFYSHFIANNLNLSEAQELALKEIDMSDLKQDKVVMFQKRYSLLLFIVVSLLLPVNAPMEYWGDSLWSAIFVIGWLRLGTTYHMTYLVHSALHIFDYDEGDQKSYDSNAVFFLDKTHWISYHYLAPWDYQTGEYGRYGTDCTSKFIRVCAALELASDLKFLQVEEVRDALNRAIIGDKNVAKCLQELESESVGPKECYLTPKKFY